ncbi:sphingomyelin phosphodiesterase-like [Saccostrea cucullata]|uniref:sphingomyelin phosphodiesterase-like n=1 Tax=Saccostrea cuccullata TaxID=36930 RepID=UPI002ED5DD5F
MEGPLVLALSLLAVILLASSSPLFFYPHQDNKGTTQRHDVITRHPKFRSSKYKTECGILTDLSFIGCEVCTLVVDGLKDLVEKQSSQEDIVEFMTFVCKKFKIEDDRVCEAIVKEYKDEFIGVALRLVLTPAEVCGILLGKICGTPYDPNDLWNVSLPDTPKPAPKPRVLPKPGSPKLRILHLSDLHIDPAYEIGSKVKCGEPLCCRQGDRKAAPGEPAAGVWGTVDSCDVPFSLVDSLFQHLNLIQDQFDVVYFTGDLPAHNVWNQSRDNQLKALQQFTDLSLKYLSNKTIYSSLGNHESAPVNSFPPPYINDKDAITWLYDAVADSWKNWLPQDTMSTIKRGGYYTVKLGDKFRLISLNMNYCNNGNWWLLINTTDPTGQLQWLVATLQQAEDQQEMVHIIGHIHPGGGSCLKAWSWNYYRIVNRYENVIAGQYFGHSHTDWYEVFYDDVTFKRPTSVLYIPGSVTTFADLNPGFRIYDNDGIYKGSSWTTLDFTNYYLNLTEVNLTNKPLWQKEYNAKETYGLKSLFPEDWSELIYRMKANDTLFQTFYRHYYKMAPTPSCTGQCKTDLLCDLKSGRSHDPALCTDI